jgi:hypothetical protein
MKFPAALFLILLTTAVQAGPRASASYSITTDTANFGGIRTTSSAYTNDGCVGVVGGVSTVAAPAEFAKAGFAGQLYDPNALSVTAATSPATVVSGANLQLNAWQNLDDSSFLAVAPGSVAWSVVSGPITGIDSTGLAMAGLVQQGHVKGRDNDTAMVRGAYGGFTGLLSVTVELPSADFTSATVIPIISDGYTATGNSITLTLDFTPPNGTSLTVVDNTGTTAIQGTFSNLAQGQIVNLPYGGQSYGFVVNYNGGSNGRSLVLQSLTQVVALPAWALVTLGVLLVAAGARAISRKGECSGRMPT